MIRSHRKAKLYIEKALDGPLSAAIQNGLDAHLADCAECRSYAAQQAQFDNILSRSLAGLGALPPTAVQKLSETVTVVAARQRRYRAWQPFWSGWKLVFNGMMLLALIAAAIWFLRPPETAVDEIVKTPEPEVTTEPSDKVTSLTSDYVVVHFDFDGSSDGLELVHPACDGMASLPQPDALTQMAVSGETPYCELITSNTLLLKPGESRQVLLIYRNDNENEIEFSFTPQAVTDLNRPFVQGICHRDIVKTNESCASTSVVGGSVWARYIDLAAPETAVLGTSIVISINVRAQELAIKP